MTEPELPGPPRIAPPEQAGGVVVPIRSREREALLDRERRRAERVKRRNRPGRIMRWRRMWLLLIPISLLALISMIFGIVIAVASDLPKLNTFIVSKDPQNTLIYDDDNHRIAVMTDSSHRAYFVKAAQIPPIMDRAIVAIEDKRFYTESGVDVRGLARAFINDLTGSGNRQGASTITEQLVKVMRGAEFHRTFLEKLTEAALAFQLSHKWSKQQILTEYLNNVYFGNGAYGIEAAAQTYFGNDPTSNLYDCGYNPDNLKDLCVANLTPAQAALLAGLVQNPPVNWSPPVVHAEWLRRNTVLRYMYQQGYITKQLYVESVATAMPQEQYVITPGDAYTKPGYGYFTSWVEQQVLDDRDRLPNPYTAGYRVHTTLDEPLQNDAQNVVDSVLPPGEGLPSAAVVVIDNATGGVKAMVGGNNYDKVEFNLATQAERQPGSSWKVFELAKALELGVSPNHAYPSKIWTYCGGPGPCFTIHNDESDYAGTRTLSQALTYSDNTVFARVGIDDGLSAVAQYAHDFGITTDISENPAMTIGGLFTGVTTLDMAHAYSTIAAGELVSGTLASDSCAGGTYVPPNAPSEERFSAAIQAVWPNGSCPGPVGISDVDGASGHTVVKDETTYTPVPGFTPYMDATETSIMRTVITEGTGYPNADVPGLYVVGKTGTTSNYRDAWFIGFSKQLTVAVWVGYVNDRSMAHTYGGKPVYGGTYPAIIFRDFMEKAEQTLAREEYDKAHKISQTALDNQTAYSTFGALSLPSVGSSTTASSTGATGATTTPTGTTAPATTTPAAGATTTVTPTTPATPTPIGAGGGAVAP